MILFARFKTILFSFFLSSSLQSVEDFKVVIYNVENLFDTDGISLYDDYKPDAYGEIELANKLNKITEVLQKISGQNGPEILLLQEIEVDRSPETAKSAASLLLEKLHAQGWGRIILPLVTIEIPIPRLGQQFSASPSPNIP